MYNRGAYTNPFQHRASNSSQWDPTHSSAGTTSAPVFPGSSYADSGGGGSNSNASFQHRGDSASSAYQSYSQAYLGHRIQSQGQSSLNNGIAASASSQQTRGYGDAGGGHGGAQDADQRSLAFGSQPGQHRAQAYSSYSPVSAHQTQAALSREKAQQQQSPAQLHHEAHAHSQQDDHQQQQQRYARTTFDQQFPAPTQQQQQQQTSYPSSTGDHTSSSWNPYTSQLTSASSGQQQQQHQHQHQHAASLREGAGSNHAIPQSALASASGTSLYNRSGPSGHDAASLADSKAPGPAAVQPPPQQQTPQHQAAKAAPPAKSARKPRKKDEVDGGAQVAPAGLSSVLNGPTGNKATGPATQAGYVNPSQTYIMPPAAAQNSASAPATEVRVPNKKGRKTAAEKRAEAEAAARAEAEAAAAAEIAAQAAAQAQAEAEAAAAAAAEGPPAKRPRGRPKTVKAADGSVVRPPPKTTPAKRAPSGAADVAAAAAAAATTGGNAAASVPPAAADGSGSATPVKRKRGRPSLPDGPKSRYTAMWRDQMVEKIREMRIFGNVIEDEQMQEDFDRLVVELETMANGKVIGDAAAASASAPAAA